MKNKILSSILAALCIVSALSSCANNDVQQPVVQQPAADVQTDVSAEPEKPAYTYNIDEEMFNIIDADGTTKFNIVRADNASDNVGVACVALKNAILDATGVELEIKTDFEKAGSDKYKRQDCEIVVGHTNRDESSHAAEKVSKARDFVIFQEGTRLAILADSDAHVADAVTYFIENFIDTENHSVAVKPGISDIQLYDYPAKSITLNGTDILEYTVEYHNAANKPYADRINRYVLDNLGEAISVVESSDTAEYIISLGGNAEKHEKYSAGISPLETRVSVDGGNIVLSGGSFVALEDELEAFVEKYFSAEISDENTAITVESETYYIENEYIRIDDKALLNDIDKKAADRRNYVKNTPNNFTQLPEGSSARIFYLSNDGSDTNDGLSPQTAFASIDKLNITGLNPGDIVLFNRGDEFRGKIKTADGVTYSAYGTGAKPVINGSKRNFADPGVWTKTDVENVYKCSYLLENVGNVVFNYSGKIGNYDELVGQLRIKGLGEFNDYSDLEKDLEFCSDLNTKEFYLYSDKGNPGSRFRSIEICESGNMFQGSNKDVVVDNLTIIFGGSHGVGTGTVENRTVQNCIFAWIGGSILKGYNGANLTRYGNAVEVYGGCDGYYVYDNWIYQIYDTGITHQYSNSDRVIKMENIEYRGNLVELCHWSIEYYNRGSMPGSCLNNIHVHDNITLYGCYGWGSVGRESGGALHNSFQIIDEVNNYLVENNIFAYSKGNVVRYNEGGDRKINFRNNTYVQYFDRALGYMFGKTQRYDLSAVTQLVEVMNEEDPIICYIMHDAEREAEEAAKAKAEAEAKAKAEAEAKAKAEAVAEAES